jgi:hypothetical protein
MDEPSKPPSEAPMAAPLGQPRRIGRAFPALALLGGLAVAWLLPSLGIPSPGWTAPSWSRPGSELHDVIGGLPPNAIVLFDVDADLGTYAEIRYATRAALADLLAGGSRLAVVSFSPEGRAVAAAEIARLRDLGAGQDRLLDLGFRSGAEAALVQLAGEGVGPDPTGPIADALRAQHGLAAVSLAVVVGGIDIGPRLWVEQVLPRAPSLRIAAISPSFLLPDVQPYRDSGQLVAVVGTLPNAVAYGQAVAAGGGGGAAAFAERQPSGLAILVGMIVSIALLLFVAARSTSQAAGSDGVLREGAGRDRGIVGRRPDHPGRPVLPGGRATAVAGGPAAAGRPCDRLPRIACHSRGPGAAARAAAALQPSRPP